MAVSGKTIDSKMSFTTLTVGILNSTTVKGTTRRKFVSLRLVFWAIVLLAIPQEFPVLGFHPVHARNAMVAAAEKHATQVGVDVMRNGGNAIDAAVAVGLALAVTEPNAGNLGGGGFMLIRLADGRSTFIDFREKAPGTAHRDMYLDANGNPTQDSVFGYRAVGVPGTVRGLALALHKYGTHTWQSMVEPAEKLARDGFLLSWELAQSLKNNKFLPEFKESTRIFLNNGNPFQFGAVLRQFDLANTLKRIGDNGPDEFYTGKTAQLIAADMKNNGGLITAEDLAAYTPVERQPVTGTYRDYKILSAPPPSSGGAGVIQILNILESFDLARLGPGSSASIHLTAEAMRRFFADRARFFGDTDFVGIPLKGMLSKQYAAMRGKNIKPSKSTPSVEVGNSDPSGYESDETTHYSIVDSAGNAVAVTYTLNRGFGSGVTAKGTGILLNNEMDDFTAKPGSPNTYGLLQSKNNAISPGKRPLSAMTPTIVLEKGRLRLVLGAQGGPTIITSVVQVILDVIEYGMNIQQAVNYPRFHHQWMPDLLYMESHGSSADTRRVLESFGHRLNQNRSLGHITAIEVGSEILMGATDSRSEGIAAGF